MPHIQSSVHPHQKINEVKISSLLDLLSLLSQNYCSMRGFLDFRMLFSQVPTYSSSD
jgi:hypothetical protein